MKIERNIENRHTSIRFRLDRKSFYHQAQDERFSNMTYDVRLSLEPIFRVVPCIMRLFLQSRIGLYYINKSVM